MTFMKNHILALTMVALAVMGCTQVKNPLARTLPDETQVLSGPNLSLPPSFELRPPRVGEPNETLLRGPATLPMAVSATAAENWLIRQAQEQAGVVADGSVRAELEAMNVSETQVEAEENAKRGLIQRWKNRNRE
jgi:hypothetical protein